MTSNENWGRALLIGAPGDNLQGVYHDVRRMADMLRRRGFSVAIHTGERATRAGILAGYDDLISHVRAGEPAVFYYSGHGFRAMVEAESRFWQGISPTDLGASTTTDFRGITAWELSIKQSQLTQRTKNVTVILDCCYAAQMSRATALHGAVPKALPLPHPFRLGFAAHLRALRDQYGPAFDSVNPTGDPDAVRLVACGQSESAYEYPGADGQYRSAFTDALLAILNDVDGVPISWAAIDHAIRERVHRRFLIQRPDIEGPAHRRLFSLDEEDVGDAITIAADPGELRLGAGSLLGVARGDVYAVMPSGSRTYRADASLGEVEITESFATFSRAVLRRWTAGSPLAVPPGLVAIPLEKPAARWPVHIDAAASARAAIEAAIHATKTLRPALPADTTAVAQLRLDGDVLVIKDALGAVLSTTRYPAQLSGTLKQLANLGTAQAIRELEGERGIPSRDIELEWGTVRGEQMQRMPDHGGALTLRDRVYVKVANRSQRTLHVHIFNIGLLGKITLLTSYAPAGIALTGEQPRHVLGERPDGVLLGLALHWPEGMPRDAHARIDEIVVIAMVTRTTLRSLETVELLAVGRNKDPDPRNLPGPLYDEHSDGRSDDSIDGFLMKRISFLLHP